MQRAADLERLQGTWEGKGPGGNAAVTISGSSLRYTQPPNDAFWYETTFTLPEAAGPKQLHATIVDNGSSGRPHIGTVVVTIFKIEDGVLTLGVVEDFEGPPTQPIVGDWEWTFDQWVLERAEAGESR